ncbi:hypothetical protein TIFTF001_017480 [Ficus carica]|uniref:Uncharacterized protein n=1 Tax=Ficus carica TaxID=3494 RepID=A0AA88DAT0_FICCA|nr:hypothetical protein TIFTF001_017480 [Ficus carica]
MSLQAVSLSFSGNVATQGYANRMKEKVYSLDTEAEKVADVKAKEAKKRASQAEDARKKAEEAQKKAEDDLDAARSEHSQYLREVLPVTLDQARRQAVKEYQNSVEFDARFLAEYKEGVTGETTTKEDQAPSGGVEEGEVTGGVCVAENVVILAVENVVVLDEPEAGDDRFGAEQTALPNQQ